LPTAGSGANKGYAFVRFTQGSSALEAFQNSDARTLQGRILHVLPAAAKKDSKLDEFAISKLPLRKQNLIRKKAEAASNSFNWNALFMSQDDVNSSTAARLGVSFYESRVLLRMSDHFRFPNRTFLTQRRPMLR